MYAATKRLKKEGSISDISAKFLNMCGINLSFILCKLFNLCLHEASYPDIFKCSRITPLYKKNERTVIDNHRPISSLRNISKVFDTLLHERITQYFMCNGLLSGNQFDFRQDRNTELATLHLIDKILPAFAEGSYCICVFLDFSSCFDTISREILYTKLYIDTVFVDQS